MEWKYNPKNYEKSDDLLAKYMSDFQAAYAKHDYFGILRAMRWLEDESKVAMKSGIISHDAREEMLDYFAAYVPEEV